MNFDWIKTRSDFDEEKPAVIDPFKGTEWTYQDLNIRAENLANYLTDQGLKHGDVVGIFAPNDVSVIDLMAASFKTGIIFLPMNWRLNPKEIASIVEDSGVKLLFYAKKHLSSLSLVDPELLHMDIDSKDYDEITNPKHHRPYQSISVEPDDTAALIYTSGTTGT
ncbi:class I adenylate-forming enzyme family protein, partial [Staphylococcus epidermidis]|uniref:class I adenylate-forming enzyme family protein n=1 Tax=Staphylococcus epidermidis TaxID=1282 RepID=UPI001368ACC5